MTSATSITLTSDEVLVLLEFFARFDRTDEFALRHNAEFLAFSAISAQLDKSSAVPFQPDYKELVDAARNRLERGFEGQAPGVIK